MFTAMSGISGMVRVLWLALETRAVSPSAGQTCLPSTRMRSAAPSPSQDATPPYRLTVAWGILMTPSLGAMKVMAAFWVLPGWMG